MAAPVYDEEDLRYRRRSDALTQQDRMRYGGEQMDAEQLAEAERQRYDERAAGIAAEDQERSQQANQVMQDQNNAATGRSGAASTIGGGMGPRNESDTRPSGDSSDPRGAANGGMGPRNASDTRPSGDPSDPRGEPNSSGSSSSSLQQKEAAGGGERSMYRDEGEKKKSFKGRVIGQFAKNKRIYIIFTSMVTAFASFMAGLFSLILPFQVPSITQALEDLKYAAFNNASNETLHLLFTSYLKNILLPGMRANGCASTLVDRSCTGNITGDSPVSLLFRKWSGAEGRLQSFESRLADRGIEITSSNGQFRMNSPFIAGGMDITEITLANGESNIFNMREMSRAEVRAEFERIIDQESGYFKKKLMRFKVGALLKKHGIIRCIIACDFQDENYGRYQDQKRAAQAFLVRRVLEPHSQLLAVYVNCLLNPCSSELASDGTVNDESTYGEPMDEIRRSSRDTLSRYSAAFGADRLQALVANAEGLNRDGLSLHMTKLAITKLGSSLTGNQITPEAATRIAQPIGWVLAAARLLVLLYDANQLKVMNYQKNAQMGVALFTMFVTVSHESRSHHMTATTLGEFTNLLRHGPFDEGPGMEDAPIYDETFAALTTSPTSAFMRTILPQKAYAQVASRPDAPQTYKCNEGTIYENAEGGNRLSDSVCTESRLSYSNIATVLSDFLQTIPGLGTLVAVIDFVRGVIDGVFAAIGGVLLDIISVIPGVNALIDTFTQWIGTLITQFMTIILKNPLGDRPSGAKTMEVMIMGAEVAGKEAGHRLAGGGKLDAGQLAEITNHELQRKRDAFALLPLKERLFSPDYPYSVTSQVAFNMPSDVNSALRRSFAGLLGNPIGKLTTSFASIFTMNQSAYAQDVAGRPSAFDITAHGIPRDHPFFQMDPNDYWNQNCADGKQNEAYNTAREDIEDPAYEKFGYIIDEATGQVVNPEPNPCFMLMTAGKFDEAPAAPGAAPTGPALPGATCADVASCAQALLALEGTQLVIRPEAKQDLQSASTNTLITSCPNPAQLNLTLLQLMNQLAATYKYRINYFITGHGCDSGFHPVGKGVDVDGVNGSEATGSAADFAIDPIKGFGTAVMATLPAGGGLGQKQCFVDVGPTTGKRFFNDGCDHIHFDVGANAP